MKYIYCLESCRIDKDKVDILVGGTDTGNNDNNVAIEQSAADTSIPPILDRS